MMRIVTAAQMKQIEAAASRYQLSYRQMMENAGCGAARYIQEVLRQMDGLHCLVFCGKGNNGGDGYVVARKLYEQGAQVTVVAMDVPRSADACAMHQLVQELGIPVLSFAQDREQVEELADQVDVVVDALYGSGFHGQLDEQSAQAAGIINSAIAAVFSLDVPSGINCDTGEAADDAVHADFTIAFDSYKPAHLLQKYLPQLGKVELSSIGADPLAYREVEQTHFVLEEEDVYAAIPRKEEACHKTSTGKLLNIAGSAGCAGACVLSSTAAMRSGAGYVVTGMPAALYPIAGPALLHSPIRFVETVADVPSALEGCSAVSIGCGLGVGQRQQEILQGVLQYAKCPVVIDADGINCLCGDISMLVGASCPVILTPHLGEMARLCGVSTAQIAAAPLPWAQKLAAQWNVIVVLKGAHTVVAAPDGRTYLNQTGNPGLAKAGSGDVLTGIIASLLSQGMEPLEAAACGVWLHGAAADRCAQRLSIYYMQPDDILSDLGELLREHIR